MELFNGKNYKEWSYSEKMAIDGAKRLGYISGWIKEPSKEDSNYEVRGVGGLSTEYEPVRVHILSLFHQL